MAFNPELNQLYVSRNRVVSGVRQCTITVVKSKTTRVLSKSNIPVTGKTGGLAVTADGKYSYFLQGSQGLVYTVDTATGSEVGKPFTASKGVTQMAIAANGKYGYISDLADGVVVVVDVQEL